MIVCHELTSLLQSVDFLAFNRGHDQRFFNNLLSASDPKRFFVEAPKDPSSIFPPFLFYKPHSSRKKIRVFFLPLWTRHAKQNIPTLLAEEIAPKRHSAVPIPPLPFALYLQIHGWVWNNNLARQNLANQRACTKRDHFANDINFLLARAIKRHAHFEWLSEELGKRLVDAAREFMGEYPATRRDWLALGVKFEVVAKKPDTSLKKGSAAAKRPTIRFESKKGNSATRMLKNQLKDLEYADMYEADFGLDTIETIVQLTSS
jgi:hypothetical protein